MVSASQNPSIFVHIAAYRDPEVLLTLRDLYNKAAHPDKIHVGVCWQYDPFQGETPLRSPARTEQVRIVNYLASQSLGVGWARHRAQKLYEDETYVLQIDSHTRFAQHWDSFLLAQWQQCDDARAILSCLPAAYDQASGDLKAAVANTRNPKCFKENGLLELQTVFLKEVPDKPVNAVFVCPKFIFAPAQLLMDVPSDPGIYFNEEEISLSLRVWSYGWNVYTPVYPPLYHSFNNTGKKRPLHWQDNTNWADLQQQALNRYLELLSGANTDGASGFGLGRSRSRHSFMAFCGIDLAHKRVTSPTRPDTHKATSESAVLTTATQNTTPPASQQAVQASPTVPVTVTKQESQMAAQVSPLAATAQAATPSASAKGTHPPVVDSKTSQSVSAPPIQVKKIASLEELVDSSAREQPATPARAKTAAPPRSTSATAQNSAPSASETNIHPPAANSSQSASAPPIQVKKIASLEELVGSSNPNQPTTQTQAKTAGTPTVTAAATQSSTSSIANEDIAVAATSPAEKKQLASAPPIQVKKIGSLEELVSSSPLAQVAAPPATKTATNQTQTPPSAAKLSTPATTAPTEVPLSSGDNVRPTSAKVSTPSTEMGRAGNASVTAGGAHASAATSGTAKEAHASPATQPTEIPPILGKTSVTPPSVKSQPPQRATKAETPTKVTPVAPENSTSTHPAENLSAKPQHSQTTSQIPVTNFHVPAFTGLNSGDFIPYFRLRDQDGQIREIHTCGGAWTMLICLPQENRAMLSRLTILKSAWEHLHRRALQIVVIVAKPPATLKQFHQQYQLPFALWSDPENEVSRVLGSYDAKRRVVEPCCYTLTPNLRIQKQYPFRNSAAAIGQILADVPHPTPLPGQIITMHAPVLIIPDVLTAEQCQRLKRHWQHSAQQEESVSSKPRKSNKPNIDIVLKEALMAEVDYILGGTLFPEIEKVFGLKVTHRESYKISSYSAIGSRFLKQQRTNFERQLSHRRVAMFLNLNDDYEGGGLNFPEYGNFVYKPIAGDAIVFPCSLMYQMLPVILGKQLVMDSFFFGEAEMPHRLEFVENAEAHASNNPDCLLAPSKIQLQGQENVRARYSFDQQ